MSWSRRVGLAGIVALCLAAALVASVPALRWRAAVITLKARGALDELPAADLARMLLPGSGVYLERLADTRNPFATIHNPLVGAADLAAGRTRYREHCSTCHGEAGEGRTAPALVGRRLRHGDSDWALFRAIRDGVPGTGMPPAGLGWSATWQIVAHLRALDLGAGPVEAPAPQRAVRPVSAGRLEAAHAEPGNWLTYGGNYGGHRRSPLAEIDRTNVAALALRWALPTEAQSTLEVTPLVEAGTLYVSVPPDRVSAIDARTGREIWSAALRTARDGRPCCDAVNRGVALLGSLLYVATIDARLLAFDSATGAPVWEARLAPAGGGYGVTGAPLAVRDMIVVGVAGSVHGVRGFLDAYDAASGERRWRFHTVPGPGAAGHDTWPEGAWRTGGAAPWTTGTYDPQRGLIYWGVGNPAPIFDGAARPGDNLYSNSVVALDAGSGALVWHFQFTPHDLHDMDATQTPLLLDADFRGEPRALLAFANRNGFYYLLDRATGEFLVGAAYARQTWAERLDARGRPVPRPQAAPSPRGTLVWPSSGGATNWWPPAFDAENGLVYVPTVEFASVYFSGTHERGSRLHLGGSTASIPGLRRNTALTAIRYDTGEIAWRRPLGSRLENGTVGGVLATAGGLVFVGDDATFYALDARNGTELWRVSLGAHIKAPPVTYEVDGRQQVAVAAGATIFAFGLPEHAAAGDHTR